MDMAENGTIRVLERALTILDYVAQSSETAGITEIAEATSLPKATVHRILQTLVARKVMFQDESGSYMMGPATLSWADGFRTRTALPHLAQSVLRDLWKRTNETVHLTVYDGDQAYYVDKLASPHPVGMRSRIGASLCLSTTAAGRAILASFSEEELRRYLASASLEIKTKNTVATEEELLELLRKTRREGYAVENEENEVGIRCIGAAILRGRECRPLGAVSLSVPAYRLGDEDVPVLGKLVREAAGKISAILNGME